MNRQYLTTVTRAAITRIEQHNLECAATGQRAYGTASGVPDKTVYVHRNTQPGGPSGKMGFQGTGP